MRLRSFGVFMATQPVLENLSNNLSEIMCTASHVTAYFDMENPVADDTHIHSCYEIYINVSGDISFLHGSSVSDITYGDAIVSHPSDVHHCIYNSSCMHEHFCIWLVGESIGKFLTERKISGRIRLTSENKERLIHIATKLSTPDLSNFLKTAYLFELVTLLANENELSSELENNSIPDKLREILAYVDANYITNISSHEIAKRFFISQSTLNRTFKKYVGMPIGSLIEAKRLSHAERLIRTGTSVTDACYSSGFNDCSRFIIKFKQKFGTTPHKYKQSVFKK